MAMVPPEMPGSSHPNGTKRAGRLSTTLGHTLDQAIYLTSKTMPYLLDNAVAKPALRKFCAASLF